MRPPKCAYCGKDLRRGTEKPELIYFHLTDKEKSYNERFKGPIVGHPAGRDWFCPQHAGQARSLNHLSLSDALLEMQTA